MVHEVLSLEKAPEKLSKRAIQKKVEAHIGAPDGWFTPRRDELSEVIDYVLNGGDDEDDEPSPPARGGGQNVMSV